MFTQPPRNVETSMNSTGNMKDRTVDLPVPMQRWTYQGQYSTSLSAHKCPHTRPINGNQGVFERFIGESKATIREYLEGKPYCFECALILHLVERILPGWAQRNLDGGRVECYPKELRPPLSMCVSSQGEFYGPIQFLLIPTSKNPCSSTPPISLRFSQGSLTDS